MAEPWRAAVYAAPGHGPDDEPVGTRLRERAQAWLGRAVDGAPVTRECPADWTRAQVDEITVSARSYGFHGTLKAPFRLSEGRRIADLCAATAELAAHRSSVVVPRLSLASIGGFFALVPGAPSPDLDSLAADMVTGLDRFRAPLDQSERERRRPATLSERQRELLDTWGYPYVLDEFRFHLTLTDAIPDGRRPSVELALRSRFDEFCGVDLSLNAVAVFTQASPQAPFVLHSVHPFRGTAADGRQHSSTHSASSPALEGTDR